MWSTGATTQSIIVTASGSYTVSYVDGNGCTSAVSSATVVTVNVPTSSTTTITACDSYTWNEVSYTTSGTYTVTGLTNAAGCDSTAILILTINQSTTSTTTITACDSYTWNEVTYTTSGTYTKLFTGGNAAGCDSTATLVLTIHQSPAAPAINAEGPTTFCEGGSVTLTSSAATGNLWSTGATTQSIIVTTSGSYTVSYVDGNGCTSAVSSATVVTVNVPTSSTTTITACDSYTWNEVSYTTSGTYTVTGLTNAAGCDSTAILVLTINQSTTSTTTITACDSYTWNEVTYTESGTYTKVFTGGNAAGCDSTATLVLTIHQSPAAPTINAEGPTTFCEGGSVTLTSSVVTGNLWSTGATTQSIIVTAPGSYTVSYVDGNGCTSAVSSATVVTVNVPTSSTTNVTICASQAPYTWNNNEYSEEGTYVVHLVNAAGCDSAATLILVIDPASVGGTVSSNATVCSGSNSGSLTLSGHTGNVIRWEMSEDGGKHGL